MGAEGGSMNAFKSAVLAWFKAIWADHYGTIIGCAVAFAAGKFL